MNPERLASTWPMAGSPCLLQWDRCRTLSHRLFPLREPGVNWHAKPLTLREIEVSNAGWEAALPFEVHGSLPLPPAAPHRLLEKSDSLQPFALSQRAQGQA